VSRRATGRIYDTSRPQRPADSAIDVVAHAVTVSVEAVRVVVQDLGPGSGTVSTIDVTERTKNPTDITVGSSPGGMALTRDGKTALVGNTRSDTVSTIDVKTQSPRSRVPLVVSAETLRAWVGSSRTNQ